MTGLGFSTKRTAIDLFEAGNWIAIRPAAGGEPGHAPWGVPCKPATPYQLPPGNRCTHGRAARNAVIPVQISFMVRVKSLQRWSAGMVRLTFNGPQSGQGFHAKNIARAGHSRVGVCKAQPNASFIRCHNMPSASEGVRSSGPPGNARWRKAANTSNRSAWPATASATS